MFRRPIHCVIVVGMTVACAPVVSPRGSTEDEIDAQVFRAAILSLGSDGTPVLVDPRPVRISAEIGYPQPADYYPVPATVRAAVLHELGVRSVSVFPLIENCDALMASPNRKDTSGCPDDEIHIAVDLPRPAAQPDEWLLRVIEVAYIPTGRSATILDLRVGRNNGRFTIRGEEILVNVH